MMIIYGTKPLFAWDCLEDSPVLRRIENCCCRPEFREFAVA
jgi:hypothetical protein